MNRGPLNNPPPLEIKTSQSDLPAGQADSSAILAQNRTLRLIAILAGILSLSVLIAAIVINYPSSTAAAPNKELIDYLEAKRQEDIKEREGILQLIQQNSDAAADRQRRDSLTDIEQRRLTQSLSNFPGLYESNNYVFNLNPAGLRREYANFKP